MTFTITEEISLGKVIKTIEEQSPLITQVSLKDQYKYNYTFTIEYHDPTKNVSGVEVEPIRVSVSKIVETKFNAQLIGQVD